MRHVEIDPNVRVRGNQTFVGFEDFTDGVPEVDESIRVLVSEADLRGHATVMEVDREKKLVYLHTFWDQLR